jgi:hypothetical protein
VDSDTEWIGIKPSVLLWKFVRYVVLWCCQLEICLRIAFCYQETRREFISPVDITLHASTRNRVTRKRKGSFNWLICGNVYTRGDINWCFPYTVSTVYISIGKNSIQILLMELFSNPTFCVNWCLIHMCLVIHLIVSLSAFSRFLLYPQELVTRRGEDRDVTMDQNTWSETVLHHARTHTRTHIHTHHCWKFIENVCIGFFK